MRNYKILYSTEPTDIIKTISITREPLIWINYFLFELSIKYEAYLICLGVFI